METKSIMIVGVGGQGTLLASRIIGSVLLRAGFDVKMSEVHGMSQRGGSVVTYVRYGTDVASPLVDKGGADYILSFELLEAARYLPWLKKGGMLVTSTQKMDPMPVITGAATYPAGLEERLLDACSAQFIDAQALALEAGNGKAANVVLLGKFSTILDFPEEDWLTALRQCVPERFLEVNQKAFSLGRNA